MWILGLKGLIKITVLTFMVNQKDSEAFWSQCVFVENMR